MASITGAAQKIAGLFYDKGGVVLNVKHPDFGAVGDGVIDDTQAIQDAINYAVALNALGIGAVVYLPSGIYKISDTLHLGLGTAFSNLVLRGDGPRYRAGTNYTGTAIVPTFSDARPCLNMQGLRMPLVEGIWFYNATGVAYYQAQGLGTATPLLDPSVATNWDYAAGVDTRYAPNAAITVDAFSGAQPVTHYPTNVNTYGKNFTIKPRIRSCGFSGFICALAVQPCDADGNGDYLEFEDNWVEYGKWGVSIGNSQSRSASIRNNQFSFLYRRYTNNQHGKQVGKFGSMMANNSGFDCDGIFEFGAATAGPLEIIAEYCESLRVIGNIAQTSSTIEYAYEFKAWDLKFHVQSKTTLVGIPQYVLTGGNNGTFRFVACNFSNYDSGLGFQPVGTEFDGGCQFRPNSARTNPYEKYAHNATAGGCFMPRNRMNGRARIKFKPYNLDTGAFIATVSYWTDKWVGDRTVCTPFYGNKVSPSGVSVWDALDNPHSFQLPAGTTAGVVVSKAAPNAVSFASGATSMEMTIVFNARTDPTFLLFGPFPGDVIYDDATGTVFFVRSRSALTVIAVAQNNVKSLDGGATFQFITAPSTTTGSLYVGNSRIYTPAKPLWGTTAVGNVQATACGTSASSVSGSSSYDTDIADGDIAMVWTDIDAWTTTIADAVLASHSSAGKTMNFSGFAGFFAGKIGKRRFTWWARFAIANV